MTSPPCEGPPEAQPKWVVLTSSLRLHSSLDPLKYLRNWFPTTGFFPSLDVGTWFVMSLYAPVVYFSISLVAIVQSLSPVWLFVTQQTAACHASLSFALSWTCSNSCPLTWWCHLTISSSVVPFSLCFHSFLASRSFPVSCLFASISQSIGASASESALPMNIQGWFSLGLTGLISLQSRGLSSLLHHHNLKASVLYFVCSQSFMT